MEDHVPISRPKGYWFGNRKCNNILYQLENCLGKPSLVGTDNLTWNLLKYLESGKYDHDLFNILQLRTP